MKQPVRALAIALLLCVGGVARAEGEILAANTVGDGLSICFNTSSQLIVCSTVAGTFTFSGTVTINTLMLTNPLAIAQGGTGSTSATIGATSPISVSGTFPNQTLACSTCVTTAGGQTIGGTLAVTGNLTLGTASSTGYTVTALPTAGPISYVSNNAAASSSAHVFSAASLPQPASTPAANGVVEIDIPSELATNAPNAIYIKNSNTPFIGVTPAPAVIAFQANAGAPVGAFVGVGTSTATQPCWQWFDAANNSLLKILCGGSTSVSNGDFTDTAGNIFAASTTSGKGQIDSAGATRVNTANAIGDYIVGGGSTATPGPTGGFSGNCSADACGGHPDAQSVYFEDLNQNSASQTCTAPFICEYASMTTTPTSYTLTFVQSFTQKPFCQFTDYTHPADVPTGVTWTGSSPYTAVKFTVTTGVGDDVIIACPVGNGP